MFNQNATTATPAEVLAAITPIVILGMFVSGLTLGSLVGFGVVTGCALALICE
jgi:hypothetical protein